MDLDEIDDRTFWEKLDDGWWWLFGFIVDFSTPILYLSDIITDFIVIMDWYNAGLTDYFDIGLAFFLLTPGFSLLLVFAFLVVEAGDIHDKSRYGPDYNNWNRYADLNDTPMWWTYPELRERACKDLLVVVFFPVLPLYIWTVNYFEIKNVPFSGAEDDTTAVVDMQVRRNLRMLKRKKKKKTKKKELFKSLMKRAIRESGLFVETVFESIPQSILQFYVMMQLGEWNTVSVISIMISLLTILTKTYVLGIDKFDRFKVFLGIVAMSTDVMYMFVLSLVYYLADGGETVLWYASPYVMRIGFLLVTPVLVALGVMIFSFLVEYHQHGCSKERWCTRPWRDCKQEYGYCKQDCEYKKGRCKEKWNEDPVDQCCTCVGWVVCGIPLGAVACACYTAFASITFAGALWFDAVFAQEVVTVLSRLIIFRDDQRRTEAEIMGTYYNDSKPRHMGAFSDKLQTAFHQAFDNANKRVDWSRTGGAFFKELFDIGRGNGVTYEERVGRWFAYASVFWAFVGVFVHLFYQGWFIVDFVVQYDTTFGLQSQSNPILSSLPPSGKFVVDFFGWGTLVLYISYFLSFYIAIVRTNEVVDSNTDEMRVLTESRGRRARHIGQLKQQGFNRDDRKQIDQLYIPYGYILQNQGYLQDNIYLY